MHVPRRRCPEGSHGRRGTKVAISKDERGSRRANRSRAVPTLFRSGYFVESFVTQTLIVFAIRTRRVPFFRSRSSVALAATTLAVTVIGVGIPFRRLRCFSVSGRCRSRILVFSFRSHSPISCSSRPRKSGSIAPRFRLRRAETFVAIPPGRLRSFITLPSHVTGAARRRPDDCGPAFRRFCEAGSHTVSNSS